MSSTFRTLNADPDFAEPPAAHTWRWSWHTRVHVAMLIVILALLIPYAGVWSVRNVDLHMTADAAGVATAQTSTAKGWQSVIPTCHDKTSCFLHQTLDAARKASLATGWPVSLIEAQWADEVGWQLPSFDGYDVANAKVFDSEQGPCLGYGTTGDYCYANTMEQGLQIWLHVARLPFYSAVATSAKSGGPKAAAKALGQSPWAESSYALNGQPGGALVAIMDDFNLYQFDK